MKVLVSDNLSEVGVEIFRQTPGIEVDVNTGLSPEELRGAIGAYHGLVIRSATKVTAEIIAAADNLKVIGRAGIGLDNVDIPAASKRGIVVMNTPEGNTVTTAEHTIAMIMAVSRNIPQATASLKEGRWEKKILQGREVFNKTLGIVGAGHIGKIVADRARGLRMKVIVYDPYIKPAALEHLELEPVGLDELLARSDYVTIHTPKTPETANLFNRDTIARMKPGAMLINCARGGIVNEDDLYDALASGQLAGAALDVFSAEPPGALRLMELPSFICTPHLGASTREAQINVARDVAEQMAAYLVDGTVRNAVNVPSVSGVAMAALRPWAHLLEKMGILQAQLADGPILETEITYMGAVADLESGPLTTAMLKGLLTPILRDDVNFVNAPVIAADRGIKVTESRSETSEDFASLAKLTVVAGDRRNLVSGTLFGGGRYARILRINDFYLEASPEGHNLLITSADVPGAMAAITGAMGAGGINISRMQVGSGAEDGQNLALLTTSTPAPDDIVAQIRDLPAVQSVLQIEW